MFLHEGPSIAIGFALLGDSLGARAWTLVLATARPNRVERVVLTGAAPLLREQPVPTFLRVLASPIGALIVRLPQSRGQARSILRQDGHGASVEAGRILFVDGVVDQISTTSTDVCTPSRICPGMSTGAVHTIYGYSPLVEHNGKTVIEYYQPETDCWLELSVREDRIESIFARCQV